MVAAIILLYYFFGFYTDENSAGAGGYNADLGLIWNNLNLLKEKYPKVIKQIRGRGYLIGIQLYKDQSKFIKKLMDHKLLTIRAAENVVRILPPLNVKKNELDQAIKIIDKVCAKLK